MDKNKRPLTSEATLFDVEKRLSPDQASRAERLETIFDNYGFYPETPRELNEAFALTGYGDDPHAVNRHLAEIYNHQNSEKTKTEDPAAAVRSVTSGYIGFASTAKANIHFAHESWLSLNENRGLTANFTSLAKTPGFVNPDDEASARGYGQLVRFHDLSNYSKLVSEGIDPLGINYTLRHPDALASERLATVLSSLRFNEGLKLAGATGKAQEKRFIFWIEQLSNAQKHMVAGPVARVALKRLGATL